MSNEALDILVWYYIICYAVAFSSFWILQFCYGDIPQDDILNGFVLCIAAPLLLPIAIIYLFFCFPTILRNFYKKGKE